MRTKTGGTRRFPCLVWVVVLTALISSAVCGLALTSAQAAESSVTSSEDLVSALAAAQSGDTVTVTSNVILGADVTVKSGVNVIVASGATLMLPCQDGDSIYDPTSSYSPTGTATSPATGMNGTLYRTLTVEQGATLTVNGTLLVNAQVGRPAAGNYDQDINGGYAQIVLNGEINVSGSGVLASYGLITGSGKVTAVSGATVIDLYVVRHWRGGSIAKTTYGKGIYPMNESDCHNIQADLVIYSGAHYWGAVRMYTATYKYYFITIEGGFHYTLFHLIDSDGLVRLTDGAYVVKKYNSGATQHTTLEIHGGATFASSSFVLEIAALTTMNLATGNYDFPMDGGVGFELYDGDYTVSNSFKLMPGCTVDVMDGANVTVSKKLALYNYDADPGYTGTYTAVNGTSYSSGTTAAQVILHGGSTLTVDGSIGGQVVLAEDATAEKPAQFILGRDATLSTTTNEMIDSSNSASYTFPLALLNADGTAADLTLAEGKTYTGTADGWSEPPTPVLPGDVNDDGVVNYDDLTIVLNNYQGTSPGDVNSDGVVNYDDLTIVLNYYQTKQDN
jgi:hypothetical protein